MQRFFVYKIVLFSLSTGGLDLLVGDSAILDYIRANDPGCTLRTHGDDIVSDTFSVAMAKGFPLKVRKDGARVGGGGSQDHLLDQPCRKKEKDVYKTMEAR